MATAIDDKIIEDSEIVIGTDTRGDSLTQSIIAERLVAYDLTDMMRCAAHGDFEYIADKLSDGGVIHLNLRLLVVGQFLTMIMCFMNIQLLVINCYMFLIGVLD